MDSLVSVALNVMRIVMEESGEKEITAASRLDEIGIDSLEFVSLIQRIEEEFGPLPKEMKLKIETVQDLIAAVEYTAC